jgi:hypothetical protein
MRVAVCAVLIVLAAGALAFAQGGEDQAIRQTVLDYLEGWYEGNVDRMDAALHPDLAKRIVHPHPQTGRSMLSEATKTAMLEYTRAGGGKDKATEEASYEVTILDVYGGMASVKAVSPDYVDYIHLVKWNNEWKILNVLWEQRPRE